MLKFIILIVYRAARDARNQYLKKLYGTVDVAFTDRPMLEVRLINATPEAFEIILNYIYTDRIDCK